MSKQLKQIQFRESNLSPSKRWSTTTTSALQDVAGKIGKIDRGKVLRDLASRKLANTKTSICFGNETVDYLSDTMENQRKILKGASAEDRNLTLQRIKQMKTDLTTTNFNLGDEVPEYQSTNQRAMCVVEAGTSNDRSERATMLNDMKEAVKKSSIHFGNEGVNYNTSAHDAMEYNGNSTNFSNMKDEVAKMTATLRKHNFSFGEEKVDYQSDYSRGFGSVPIESYRCAGDGKAGIRAVIEDSRKCHFSLGQDAIKYQTNTQSALGNAEGHSSADMMKGMERARDMKTALQKTSIIIGDDRDYM